MSVFSLIFFIRLEVITSKSDLSTKFMNLGNIMKSQAHETMNTCVI